MSSDYITIEPAVGYQRWVVVVMKQQKPDEYFQTRVSQAMRRSAADALARSWAAAMQLEVRV